MVSSDGVSWEQRWHPLREEWVIIAAHRQDRPWHGETRNVAKTEPLPEYVPDCYLCPGNARVGGARNENYRGIYVFDNDHPCVGETAPSDLEKPAGIYVNRPATGVARVLCYSPKHNLTLAELEIVEIENLLIAWRQQYVELGSRREITHVLVFENKGEVVGVSNPHPHCQIYATNFVFKTIETDTLRQIEDALKRIADGTFGTCISCGGPVPKARLEVVPHARFCMKCLNKRPR